MSTVNAEYDIRIAWAGDVTNPFKVGVSTLGGGAQLGGSFASDFSGLYDNVSADTEEFKWERGRDDPQDDVRAGWAEIVLFDLTGKYNPENSSSPLYGLMTPMREVRIQATYAGVVYGLFRGFIRNLEYDPLTYRTTVYCEDLFLPLDRVRPIVAPTSGKTGALIQQVLTAAAFTQPTLTNVDVTKGDNVANFSLDGTSESRSALAAIADLLESERGIFFASKDGVATYADRYTQATKLSSVTLTDVFANAIPGVSLENLKNIARVTKEGGVQQVATSDASVALYGPSDISIESPYFESDAQAAQLATYLIWLLASPSTPVYELPFVANFDAATMVAVLGREVFDRVTLTSTQGGLSGDYYIESMTHYVRTASKHEVSWSLSKRQEPGELFVIGRSTLGGGDILAYY